MEPGLASGWMDHVRHVAGVTLQHAKRLAACPQVRGQREVVLLVGCNSSHGVMRARNKKKIGNKKKMEGLLGLLIGRGPGQSWAIKPRHTIIPFLCGGRQSRRTAIFLSSAACRLIRPAILLPGRCEPHTGVS
jgi:hypothetical protein